MQNLHWGTNSHEPPEIKRDGNHETEDEDSPQSGIHPGHQHDDTSRPKNPKPTMPCVRFTLVEFLLASSPWQSDHRNSPSSIIPMTDCETPPSLRRHRNLMFMHHEARAAFAPFTLSMVRWISSLSWEPFTLTAFACPSAPRKSPPWRLICEWSSDRPEGR